MTDLFPFLSLKLVSRGLLLLLLEPMLAMDIKFKFNDKFKLNYKYYASPSPSLIASSLCSWYLSFDKKLNRPPWSWILGSNFYNFVACPFTALLGV
jgi:hypothetical protein